MTALGELFGRASFEGTAEWFLLESALRATCVLLAATILMPLLRRSSAAVRHRLWLITTAAVLLIPIGAIILPPMPLALLPAPTTSAATSVHAQPESPEDPQVESRTELSAAAADLQAPASDEVTLPLQPATEAVADTVPPSAIPAESIRGVDSRQTQHTKVSGFQFLICGWCVGALVVLCATFAGWLAALRIVNRSTIVTDIEWQQLKQQLALSIGCSPDVELRRFDQPISPMTWGWRRPVILLPGESESWSRECRRAVLLHELAHIERLDWLSQLLAQLMCVLYWFHPLAWMANREIRRESDRAADDLALAAGMTPATYAEQLLFVAQKLSTRWLQPTPTMARRSGLTARIEALLDRSLDRRPVGWRLSLLSLIAGIGLLIPVAAISVTVADDRRAENADGTASEKRKPISDQHELSQERAKLEQERLATLQQAVEAAARDYEIGVYSLDDYLSLLDKSRAAELQASQTAEQRAAAIARYLEISRALEREIVAKYVIGAKGGSTRELSAARRFRLVTELANLNEQTGDAGARDQHIIELLTNSLRDVSETQYNAAMAEYQVGTVTEAQLVQCLWDINDADSRISSAPRLRYDSCNRTRDAMRLLLQATENKFKLGARGGSAGNLWLARSMTLAAEIDLLNATKALNAEEADQDLEAEIAELQKKRIAALNNRLKATRDDYIVGTADVEELLRAVVDYQDAWLQTAENEEKRRLVLRKSLQQLRSLEEEVKAKHDIGARGGSRAKLLRCREARLATQLRLLKLEARIGPKTPE